MGNLTPEDIKALKERIAQLEGEVKNETADTQNERLAQLESEVKNETADTQSEREEKTECKNEKQEIDNSANPEPHLKTGAEKALYRLSNISLVLGIIMTIYCVFKLVFIKVPHYNYSGKLDTTTEFSLEGLVVTFFVLAYTIFVWATLRVQANISMTLKDINHKIK